MSSWEVPPAPTEVLTPAPPPPSRWTAWTGTTRGLVTVCALAGVVVGGTVGGVARAAAGGSARTASTVSLPPQQGVAGIVATLTPSLVDVTTELGYQRAEGAGTGMVLTSDGEILTNNHVVDGATSIRVTMVNTGRTYVARVLGTDRTGDVALLKIDAAGLTPIRTSTTAPNPGDQIVSMGNALGRGGATTVTGTVTALGQEITATDADGSNPNHLSGLIETSARLQPGDSGGPLVDTRAQVIGMDTATSVGRGSAALPDSYAIPIGRVLDIAHQIERGQSSSAVRVGLPAFLGVSLDSAATGAVVADVVSGSPAERAGVVAGDTITAVAGVDVRSSRQVIAAIQAHRPGETVTLQWTTTDGSSRQADVALTSGPPD